MRYAATLLLLPVLITSGPAAAAPPKIHAQWENGGQFQPILDQHYFVDPTNPDSPNIQLAEGRSDWRIWSTDVDATDGVGVLGTATYLWGIGDSHLFMTKTRCMPIDIADPFRSFRVPLLVVCASWWHYCIALLRTHAI